MIDGFLSAKADSGRDDLILTGYDIVAQSLAAIKDGRQAFTIDQQQFWRGYMPVVLLTHNIKYGLLTGELLPDRPDHRRHRQRGEGGDDGRSRLPVDAASTAEAGRGPPRFRHGPGPAHERAHRGPAGHDREAGRGAAFGEAFRRFMLRPESTALAAVVVLFARLHRAQRPTSSRPGSPAISIMAIAAELGIVSIGVTLLMIGGHFDLSVGAVLGLTSYVAVVLMRDLGLSPLVAAPAAVPVGACLGAVNGRIVVRFRIHSFVVTLGTMLIWRGVLIALTGGFPMTVDIPPAFKDADGRAAARRLPDVDALVLRASALLGDLPAHAHPVRQLDAGLRPEPAGGAQSRRAGRPGRRSSCS